MKKRAAKEEWLEQFEFDSMLLVYRKDGVEFSEAMVSHSSLPELKLFFQQNRKMNLDTVERETGFKLGGIRKALEGGPS
jgi:hypothetical protein